jgi:hypothetical protein
MEGGAFRPLIFLSFRYLDRPARKQAAGPVTPTHSGFYNLWYHRISGDYDFKDRPKRLVSR